LADSDPDLVAKRWEEIKRAALDELRSGHRAAKAMDGHESHCWQRAQFLAVRNDFIEAWQPRNGVERQLIDNLAQAQTCWLRWIWEPPRVGEVEANEQAAAMVDRFNRIFLRTLRALRDLRRYAGPVIVQNAGQVNVVG
jgi:hypothetical protein